MWGTRGPKGGWVEGEVDGNARICNWTAIGDFRGILNIWWGCKGKEKWLMLIDWRDHPQNEMSLSVLICVGMWRGGGCIRTMTYIRGESERLGVGAWWGICTSEKEGRRKRRKRIFFKKKKTQTIFFSQFALIMTTLLSLFLLPTLCIDKLSNPTRS